MNAISVLGLGAEALIVVAQIPQIHKSFKTRRTDDISGLTIVCAILGFCLWLLYGFLKPDGVIVIANGVSIVMFTLVLYAKIRFSKN